MRLIIDGLYIGVGGVTTEDDALLSIGLGASAVGFDFGPTPRQVSPTFARDIIRRLPQGALTVGSFRNEMPERVAEIANTLGLSVVQIEGSMTVSQVSWISERVNTVFRMVSTLKAVDLVRSAPSVDYFVMPEQDEHNALVNCVDDFADEALRVPCIASGGLSVATVVDVVQNYPVWGVEARGGVESSPGVKDPVLLGDFISNARWAYENSYVERNDEDFFGA
jgi:phosphoribosylanthranilate isomerase